MAFDLAQFPPLVCPRTREPLRLAPAGLVARLEAARAAGSLRFADGRPVEAPLDVLLVREDGRLVYRVDDGIPVLLVDEAIPVP